MFDGANMTFKCWKSTERRETHPICSYHKEGDVLGTSHLVFMESFQALVSASPSMRASSEGAEEVSLIKVTHLLKPKHDIQTQAGQHSLFCSTMFLHFGVC